MKGLWGIPIAAIVVVFAGMILAGTAYVAEHFWKEVVREQREFIRKMPSR